MILRAIKSLGGDESGAISPLYAVAILALVGMAGIGFDYGRIMALDTELQNAADQAALAAATQLDGTAGARTRATDAATNAFADAASPYVNETRFANDGSGRPITNLSFKFYDSYGANDALGGESTTDQDARVVEVTVNTRTVRYALTPVIGAIRGDAIGRAMATLDSAVCNVPPIMFCLPNGGGGVDHSFPTAADIGKSLQLHIKKTSGTWPWAPGNFGFLDIDYDIGGKDKTRSLGLNESYLGCTAEAVQTEPGNKDPQGDALSSRMDEYTGSVKVNDCNADGDFCPSNSTRKDFFYTETSKIEVRTSDPMPARPSCGTYDSRSGPTANSTVNSFKADNCIVNGTCSILGDSVWDYTSYFNARHNANASYPIPTAADFGKASMDDVTRYDVYQWELEDPANRLKSEQLPSSPAPAPEDKGNKRTWTFTNHCAYPTPQQAPPGIPASASQKDRRVLTVAAVDCTGLNGRGNVSIVRWVDVFMLEPVNTTSSDKMFRTEIIGVAQLAGGGSGFQYYSRKKAVLIR